MVAIAAKDDSSQATARGLAPDLVNGDLQRPRILNHDLGIEVVHGRPEGSCACRGITVRTEQHEREPAGRLRSRHVDVGEIGILGSLPDVANHAHHRPRDWKRRILSAVLVHDYGARHYIA